MIDVTSANGGDNMQMISRANEVMELLTDLAVGLTMLAGGLVIGVVIA